MRCSRSSRWRRISVARRSRGTFTAGRFRSPSRRASAPAWALSGRRRSTRAGFSATNTALGVVEQTLYNWVKADREGKLAGAGTKSVSPEQMELARLRAEVARLKMERDILKKAAAYFAKESM